MSKILLSINEEHVINILSNKKKYEYRSKVAKKKIDTIVIYCTAPIKKVVAEVEVIGIIEGKPDDVWLETKNQSGISEEFYNGYFKGRDKAYAYKLGKVKEYSVEKKLIDFGVGFAPQSFVYL
jgi:predicted transcriptional regulator